MRREGKGWGLGGRAVDTALQGSSRITQDRSAAHRSRPGRTSAPASRRSSGLGSFTKPFSITGNAVPCLDVPTDSKWFALHGVAAARAGVAQGAQEGLVPPPRPLIGALGKPSAQPRSKPPALRRCSTPHAASRVPFPGAPMLAGEDRVSGAYHEGVA
jgi:hypothetical protein